MPCACPSPHFRCAPRAIPSLGSGRWRDTPQPQGMNAVGAVPCRYGAYQLCGRAHLVRYLSFCGPVGRLSWLRIVHIASSAIIFAWSTARSEEHTSELQSLMRISYAVFCLKKKKAVQTYHKITRNNA